MLSPVSPSATGNTLRSLTSSLRDSRCASAPATAMRKRSRLVSVTATTPITFWWLRRLRDRARSLRAAGQAGRPRRARPSGGLRDLAGFEAARAHVDAPRRFADHDPDLLQVRVEAALGGDHRVAEALPEGRALFAA